MLSLPKSLKRRILNRALKRLYNTISVDDVLQTKGNVLFVGDKEISQTILNNLQQEATLIKDMYLWQILTNHVKFLSNERMFDKSKNDDDIVFGKATLYNLKIQEDIINKILKIKNK